MPFLSHTATFSVFNRHMWPMAAAIGPHRYRTLASSQKVPLDSATLGVVHAIQDWLQSACQPGEA